MAVLPQRVALTCCGRVAVTFDYPRLSVLSGNWEYGDAERDPAGWSRGKTWCSGKRHRYERVLKASTIIAAIEASHAPLTFVASHSRLKTASALRRGDIDETEASQRRRGTLAQMTIPLDSL